MEAEVIAFLLAAVLAQAADRPIGTTDKTMYKAWVGVDVGASGDFLYSPRAQVGGSAAIAASNRVSIGGSLHHQHTNPISYGQDIAANPNGTTTVTTAQLVPTLGADYALLGTSQHGLQVAMDASWQGYSTYTMNDAGRFDPTSVGILGLGLGFRYRWAYHPGALMSVQLGARTPVVDTFQASFSAPLAGYLSMTTSGVVYRKGPAPYPGHRNYTATGHHTPEFYIVRIGGGLAAATAAVGIVYTVLAFSFIVRNPTTAGLR